MLQNRFELVGTSRQVKQAIPPSAVVFVDLAEAFAQPLVTSLVAELALMIKQRLRKCFPDFVAHRLARKFPHGFLHLFPKIVIALRPARETDDHRRGRQFAIIGKVVERRNQFPMRQIAGGAENHNAAWLGHRARRQTFAQRIRLLLLSGTIHESIPDYADVP